MPNPIDLLVFFNHDFAIIVTAYLGRQRQNNPTQIDIDWRVDD